MTQQIPLQPLSDAYSREVDCDVQGHDVHVIKFQSCIKEQNILRLIAISIEKVHSGEIVTLLVPMISLLIY